MTLFAFIQVPKRLLEDQTTLFTNYLPRATHQQFRKYSRVSSMKIVFDGMSNHNMDMG